MVFPKKPTLTEEGIVHHVCSVCLYEEEVTLSKLTEEPVMQLFEKNGEYCIHASNGGLSAYIWIASYKNGRMIDIKKEFIRQMDMPVLDASVGTLELNISDADEIRAFMFSYDNKIKPLLPAARLKITGTSNNL